METVASLSPLDHLLSRLEAKTLTFPHPVEKLEVVQTHISTVLLAGEFAYKIKKPVSFPFVDYSALEKRRGFCQLEMVLNRRLAETVYLGVVPITRSGSQLNVEGTGEAVEYAVKMRRLPDAQRLGSLLEKGLVPDKFWTKLANRLTRFYREAARGPEVSKWATPQALREDWGQIFSQIRNFTSGLLEPAVLERLVVLWEEGLDYQRARIEKRFKASREGHGDLRLEHIYFFPEETEPLDLSVIDCVEFNTRYRCADPLCDVAFLLMDLEIAGYYAESDLFKREFLKASGEGVDHLLDFYTAYRHMVRGLVRGLQAREEDAIPEYRVRAEKKSQAHFLQALSKLEEPNQKPGLILVGGLPGAGKSTLVQKLAQLENFQSFSSDATRKELAGQALDSQHATGYERGIYKAEWTEKTYGTLLERVRIALRGGHRVLVDASFSKQIWRERFKDMAKELGVQSVFFVCLINHDTAGIRLAETHRFGSDADLEIYRNMAAHWERPSPELGTLFLNTERPIAVSLAEIHRTLEQRGLTSGNQLQHSGRVGE